MANPFVNLYNKVTSAANRWFPTFVYIIYWFSVPAFFFTGKSSSPSSLSDRLAGTLASIGS